MAELHNLRRATSITLDRPDGCACSPRYPKIRPWEEDELYYEDGFFHHRDRLGALVSYNARYVREIEWARQEEA